MSELIPITETEDGIQAVMGRELHAFLEVGRDYTNWFKQMTSYGFTEGQDFELIKTKTAGQSGSPNLANTRHDHVVTLDMAKEVAMIQRTEKGKQARQYFIEVEKRAKTAAPTLPQSMSEALRLAADEYDRAEIEKARADKAEKKAEAGEKYRKAHEAGDGITVSDFGRKYFSEEQYMQVFEHLYKHGYLIDQRGTRTTRDGKKKDGYDHMKPKAKGRKFFYLHGGGVHGGKQRHHTRVRPQMEIALRDVLIAEGLAPNTHSTGLVLFNTEDLKGISA